MSDLYEILPNKLSEGSFGQVKLARNRVTQQLVVIKSIDRIDWNQNEYVALTTLHHPSILKLKGYYIIDGVHTLVTEYAAGGDLYDYFERQKYFDEETVRNYMRQIGAALIYIHTSGFAHLDLKLENLFLDETRERIIIGDWGHSVSWSPSVTLTFPCGTRGYASPEMMLNLGYHGPEVDMWTVGIMIFILLVGESPFEDCTKFDPETVSIRIPSRISSTAIDLIFRLLCPAETRLTSEQFMEHPWMKIT